MGGGDHEGAEEEHALVAVPIVLRGGKRASSIKVMDAVVRGYCDNLREAQLSLKLIFTRFQVFHRKEILFMYSKATFDAAITSDS